MPKKKVILRDEPVPARPHRNMVSIDLLNPNMTLFQLVFYLF